MANPLPSDKTPGKSIVRTAGSSIAGERIAAQARKFVPKPSVVIGGITKESCLLTGNACCFVERALEIRKTPPTTKDKKPAASPPNCIYGHTIVGQARSISYVGLTTGSSKHKIQKYALRGDAYCVIRRELAWLHDSTV